MRSYIWSVQIEDSNTVLSPFSNSFSVDVLSDHLLVTEPTDGFSATGALEWPEAPTLVAPPDLAELYALDENTFEWMTSNGQSEYCFSREGGDGFTLDFDNVTELPDITTNDINDLVFSPNNQLLVASTDDNVIVYNTADWTVATTLEADSAPYRQANFSPDGSLLVIAGERGVAPRSVYVYNTADWTKVSNFTPADVPYWGGAVFNSDGSQLAVGGLTDSNDLDNNSYITIYNTADWTVNKTIQLPTSMQSKKIYWSNDDAYIVAAGWDSAFIVEVATDTIASVAIGESAAIHPSSTYAVLPTNGANGAINTFDFSTWQLVTENISGVTYSSAGEAAFSSDGKYLVMHALNQSSQGSAIVNTLDWSHQNTGELRGLAALSPDNTMLARGNVNHIYIYDVSRVAINYWNGASWQLEKTFVSSVQEEETFPSDAFPVI